MRRYHLKDDDRESVLRLIDSISDLDRSEAILVEGKNDRRALQSLGVRSDICLINNGKSTVESAELFARKYSKIIILTDWDRTGGRLAKAFAEQFLALGLDFSLQERKEMSYLCKKDIKDVESLYEYLLLSG